MVSLSTWFRYVANKFEYSLSYSWKRYNVGQINGRELSDAIWKNFFQGKLTYLHWTKGEEMAPTITGQGGTLLVRKLPSTAPTHVFVGDVVVVKDPEKTDGYLVRRLAAIEGYEMVSKDEKDTPFVLEKDECWVVSDNESLKPKEEKLGKREEKKGNNTFMQACALAFLESRDSRLFGPVPMTDIVGRVIYCLRSAVDHGPVQNSRLGMLQDSSVLAVELDVDDMTRKSKT